MPALYQKYRPKTFSEIIGQEMIIKILKNAVAYGKISHAYLFSGPRGIGKTSLARILAKAANCQQLTAAFEPCNRCLFCQQIDQNRTMDIIEIDAASNRGIDEIRNLKENVKAPPSFLRKKVFIIDECQQLTKEAFNALLKTLEEPPADIILILATTEFSKMPATIVSRTQQFHFKRIPFLDIKEKLKKIAQQEKIKITEPALELIAASASGSIRDGESLLDQLSSFLEKEITVEEAEKMLGKVTSSKIALFSELLLQGNSKEIFSYLEEIEESGSDLIQFTKDLIFHLRRVLVLKYEPTLRKIFEKEVPEEILKKMEKQAKIIKEKHLGLLKSLITAYSQMKYSPFPLVSLEIAIVENL